MKNVEGTHEEVNIRFEGLGQYASISFKIAHKEWDTSEKHGFKCCFDKGVL